MTRAERSRAEFRTVGRSLINVALGLLMVTVAVVLVGIAIVNDPGDLSSLVPSLFCAVPIAIVFALLVIRSVEDISWFYKHKDEAHENLSAGPSLSNDTMNDDIAFWDR